MEIKPKYNTNTIRLSAPIKKELFDDKIVKDPKGVIPNGIYKVIRWEKLMQIIGIVISGALLLAMTILIMVYAIAYSPSWSIYILPVIIGIGSLWKLTYSVLERMRLKKELIKYREDLKIGLTSQPPFIIRIYRNTFIKQVRHNWITFFLLFNGSLFTLLLWWLKDVSWWIFDFSGWIDKLFWNPNVMVILFAIGLAFIAVVHVIMAIQRKKRIIEIDAYLGTTVVPAAEIEELKARLNKAYRRMFIFYLMIVFIIPIVIKVIIKLIRRK